MNERRIETLRLLAEDARDGRVDRHRHIAFLLGAVDGRVRGGVEDQRRPKRAHDPNDGIGIREIQRVAIERDDVADACQRGGQFAPELAARAGDENLHG